MHGRFVSLTPAHAQRAVSRGLQNESFDSGDAQAKADCLENIVVGPASEVCIDEFNYQT